MSNKKTLNDFMDCYTWLAELGVCVATGGAEYKQFELAWQQAKRPSDIAKFIRARAAATPRVIDHPCPKCRNPSPHNLTESLLSECRACTAQWL